MKKMGFISQNLKLSPNNVEHNPRLRSHYKLLLNAIIGRFAMKNDKPITKYVHSQGELADLFWNSKYTIEELFLLTEKTCQVKVTPKKNRTKLSTCISIAAFVTSLSRIHMNIEMQKLLDVNATLLYHDCDSIIFSIKNSTPSPLAYGYSFGQYKLELGEGSEAKAFYALGKKNYSITYKDSSDKTRNLTRISGLSLTSNATSDAITPDVFSQFLKSFVKNEKKFLQVPQVRKIKNKKNNKPKKIIQQVTLDNCLTVCRIVDYSSPNLVTYPYGFQLK